LFYLGIFSSYVLLSIVLCVKNRMEIIKHETSKISSFVDIENSPRGTKLIIGKNSLIDSFVKIKPVGGKGNISIGDNSDINSNCVLYSGNGITIGNNVLIAAGCIFASTSHAYCKKNKTIREQRFLPSKGGILIEDDVWIGAGTVILDGAKIRKGSVIVAQSLVIGETPEYSISGGNPIKVMNFRS